MAVSRSSVLSHGTHGNAAIFRRSAANPLDGILSQARMRATNGDVRRITGGVAMAVTLSVNGASRTVPAEPDTPLLYVLRNDLELNGAKFGCGLAQCGACTVLVNGQAMRSCVTPIDGLAGAE